MKKENSSYGSHFSDIVTSIICADPESFIRDAISRPSSTRQRNAISNAFRNAISMAFRWRADDGLTLNAGSVAL